METMSTWIRARLFKKEKEDISKVVLHAKDSDGYQKYQNESHLIRCAILKLLREEKPILIITPGRPKKWQ